jgi:hypothetical protein
MSHHTIPRGYRTQQNVVNITKANGGKQRRVPLDAETIMPFSEHVSAAGTAETQPIFAIVHG